MDQERHIYYAHTHPSGRLEDWQTMLEHAQEVARLAGQKAAFFGESVRAELAGKLHDLGKYGDLFQKRLHGEGSGFDHWTAGAHIAIQEYRSLELALIIQGHHIGLQKCDADSVDKIWKKIPSPQDRNLTLTEKDFDLLKRRLEEDFESLSRPDIRSTGFPSSAGAMLDTRMLFSALVDADHLDTERTMNKGNLQHLQRPMSPGLNASAALERLEQLLGQLSGSKVLPEKTRFLRQCLMEACRDSAALDGSLWTLTAPTGMGKTLGMLLFALKRATRDPNVRRIIVVLPFLSILDQTVKIYRELFKEFGEHYILEHHSLAGTKGNESQTRSPKEARLLIQNWDSPIIITTSVQFLESLHANRPSTCRKLHNIAGSIVLFDEVQTLPVHLATLTLKSLSRLASPKYHSTIIFSTATQPAFETLHQKVLEENENTGWQPREIVPTDLNLFSQFKRVSVDWTQATTPTSWTTVADWLEPQVQILSIVNLKRHAAALANFAKERELEGVLHLSTALCPKHRQHVLDRVREMLDGRKPCRVIATQCVEAGVDLDFPYALRSMGPLDSIAQAAGRCNRNARLSEGVLKVFLPEDEKYPPGIYEKAASVTKALLREYGSLDIDDPKTFQRYFRRLYSVSDTDVKELIKAVKNQDYVRVSELYALIENITFNVVVPYDMQAIKLIQKAKEEGIDLAWIRNVRSYTVGVYKKRGAVIPAYFEPVSYRLGKGEPAEGWYVCEDKTYYDELFGLLSDQDDTAVFSSF